MGASSIWGGRPWTAILGYGKLDGLSNISLQTHLRRVWHGRRLTGNFKMIMNVIMTKAIRACSRPNIAWTEASGVLRRTLRFQLSGI
jgi:hypothetical protein